MPPPDGTRFQGQDAVRALWNDFFESSSSIEFDNEDIFACGDRCLVQWTFRWVGQDNQPGSVRGVDLFKIRDGKVSEKLVYVKGRRPEPDTPRRTQAEIPEEITCS